MKSVIPLVFFGMLSVSSVATGAQAAENRCGYIENPTPGNWWLTDADASWTIGTQGSDSYPDGFDLVPISPPAITAPPMATTATPAPACR